MSKGNLILQLYSVS